MINIKQITEYDYNTMAGVDWPPYHDVLSGNAVLGPAIEQVIAEFVGSTKDQGKNGYDYLSLMPDHISQEQLTDDQLNKLVHSDTFCMMPWVHMHAFPDGRVYPCCLADYWHPLGDLRKNTMEEVWNQPKYREIRLNMLNDSPSLQCTKCYEIEKHGGFSMRNDANKNYGHLIGEIDKTLPDGEHPEFKLRYWDVRFSNLCNFRCRSCGPIFSSNWYADHVKMYKCKPEVLGRELAPVEYAGRSKYDICEQMMPHVPYLEQVYFAGGEPLIMEEHYLLLEELIRLGKTDVRLTYNTNFSELRYKNKHVFDYWKHFTNVSVGASLDASGSRAELIRKGTDWKQTVENRERMMREVPHVDFYVSATVSAMNVLHVLDFHREWSDLGLITPKDFNVNICQSPQWYRADIFPSWFKNEVITPAYEDHISWVDPQDNLRRATNGFKSMLSFINSSDASALWKNFINETHRLDKLREENFWDTFPEYAKLKNE